MKHKKIAPFALACLPALIAALSNTAFAQEAASAQQAKDSKLPEVQIVGSAEQKYATKSSSTATKTDTLLRDTPQSITVITKELMRDQAMQSMTDAVTYVPGIVAGQGEGNRDTAIFRGNSSTADFYVDGVRDDVQYYRDFYNIERVEALKGSNAMIFGQGGSGGVINRVTKQPQWKDTHEVTLTVGSFSNRRVTADLGTAVDKNVAFRVTGLNENSESFRKGVYVKRSGINPGFAVRVGKDTNVNVNFEHFRDERVADRGIPSYLGKPLETDTSTFFGNAAMSPTWSRVNAFNAVVDHDFGNGLSLRNRSRYADYDKFYQNIFPGAVSADGKNVSISAYSTATQRQNFFNQTDLTFDLHTGDIKHKVLAGVEFGRQSTDNLRNTGYVGSATSVNVALNNPLATGFSFKQSATDANNHGIATVAAIYAQDQIEFSPQWQAVFGLRRDQFKVDFTNNRNGQKIDSTDTPISPRAGLIYKPFAEMSIYTSYSVAFAPRAGEQLSSLSATNKAFDPEKFTNIEIGAKWDVSKDLSLSAAVYQLDRGNVVIADPNNPALSILVDGQRAQGVELGVTGKITPQWSIMGGYAYQDAKVTRDLSSTLKAGTTLAHVPEHSASLWNRFDLNKDWGFAAGVVYRGEVFPSTDHKVVLPAYTRLDAALYYTVNANVQLQMNVENLADTKYYASAHNNNNILPGSPRALRLGVNLKF